MCYEKINPIPKRPPLFNLSCNQNLNIRNYHISYRTKVAVFIGQKNNKFDYFYLFESGFV